MSFRSILFSSGITTALLGITPAAGSDLKAEDPRTLPAMVFSIGDLQYRTPGKQADGPLIRRVKAAFAAANEGDGAGFGRLLGRDAKLSLNGMSLEVMKQPSFMVRTIRAATESCFGPWGYKEGPSWAQVSWVCSVEKDAPIAEFIEFNHSPEVAVTVRFKDGMITWIDAMEPLRVIGMRYVEMNACETLRKLPELVPPEPERRGKAAP